MGLLHLMILLSKKTGNLNPKDNSYLQKQISKENK